jgi:hypothetical protein
MLWIDFGSRALAKVLGRRGRLSSEFHAGEVLGNRERADLLRRIRRLCGAGYDDDGIHVLMGKPVDDLDYALMGAANACARIKAEADGIDVGWGGIGAQWFALDPKAKIARRSFGNSHAMMDKATGEWITETALLEFPRRFPDATSG